MTFISHSKHVSLLTRIYTQTLAKLLQRVSLIVNSMLLLSVAFLSGCNVASTPASTSVLNTNIVSPQPFISAQQSIERMDLQCINQVHTQQAQIPTPSISQSLSLANAAQHCVGDIRYSPKHPDVQTAMQFSALAFVNYMRAGDMQTATSALAKFRATFPQQDLLFADYTSFVDTATVLVNQGDLSSYQLTSLNINPTLRAEITRQRKWSLR